MSNPTKGCNLTEKEVMQLMAWYGYSLGEDTEDKMERLKYLNSRLKSFREPENVNNAAQAAVNQPTGAWTTNG